MNRTKNRRTLVTLCALLITVSALAALAQPVGARTAPAALDAGASGGGPIGGTLIISSDGRDELRPSVAYNPDRQEYLVVWHRDTPGYPDIRGRRISRDGAPLGPPFTIAGGEFRELYFPDVAYSPHQNEYLVVWQEYSQTTTQTTIRGRRFSGIGNPVTASFDVFGTEVSQMPAVAYASTSQKFLVVWEWFDLTGFHITGRTFQPGVGLGTTRHVYEDTAGEAAHQPDVAYCRTRNEHLVVWRQDGSDQDIHARRVTGAGQPMGGPALHVCSLGHDDTEPAVAALPMVNNRGNYLVTWEQNDGTSDNILARPVEVASNGTPSMGIYRLLAVSPDDEVKPAVAGSESRGQYLVTWQQQVRHGEGYVWVSEAIVGRSVAVDGTPQGDAFQEVGGFDAGWSAAAPGPVGDFLVAFEDQSPTQVMNMLGRLWGNRVYLPLILR